MNLINVITKLIYAKTSESRVLPMLLLTGLLASVSCRKFVEIPPPANSITGDVVFTTNASAISVLTELFSSLNNGPIQTDPAGSISLFAGLAADEYTLNDGIMFSTFLDHYTNSLTTDPTRVSGSEHWAPLYNFVFKCNAAIEGLNASNSLHPVVKKQLIGEAKFMRAFFYFYLVNMFGDVPLTLTTDPEINALLPRAPVELVYDQIINDLIQASESLSDNFLDATLLNNTIERVRPTKWAAAALLARVYLYKEDWTNAETQSTAVINNPGLFLLSDSLNDVFLKNSSEAIWQIQPVNAGYNTPEARTLIIPEFGPTPGATENPIQLSSFLLNSFEGDDKRKTNRRWIDSVIVSGTTYYFPYKYKIYLPNSDINPDTKTSNISEYFMMLRLAEQYLIRAEARAKQNKISEGQADLNVIRNRAGLPNTIANDQPSLLAAILHERQVELFSEWGHRWFDLKRTGKIDEVMTAVTPLKSAGTTQWQSYQQFYPISLAELQRAPNFVQTPGY